MKTIQKRIGLIFTIFSLLIFGSRLIPGIKAGEPFMELLVNTGTILFMGLLFLPTIKWEHWLCKVYQVFIVSVVALLSFIDSYDSSYSFIFIAIAVILSFAYGWYNRNFVVKAIVTVVFLYAFLVVFSLQYHPSRWSASLNLTSLIVIFIFILWVIAKDYINAIETDTVTKIKKIESDLLEYKNGIEKEEADYEVICKNSIETNKALLALCKQLARKEDNNVRSN